jgi:hypothetical protein
MALHPALLVLLLLALVVAAVLHGTMERLDLAVLAAAAVVEKITQLKLEQPVLLILVAEVAVGLIIVLAVQAAPEWSSSRYQTCLRLPSLAV